MASAPLRFSIKSVLIPRAISSACRLASSKSLNPPATSSPSFCAVAVAALVLLMPIAVVAVMEVVVGRFVESESRGEAGACDSRLKSSTSLRGLRRCRWCGWCGRCGWSCPDSDRGAVVLTNDEASECVLSVYEWDWGAAAGAALILVPPSLSPPPALPSS